MASVSTKLEVSGSQQFKKDFKEAANAVKTANSELKFFSNELARNGASADALKNKLNSLNKAYDAESVAVEKLQQRLDELSKDGKENSTEFVKLTSDLYKHKDAQAQLEADIRKTTDALDKFGTEADEADNETRQLNDTLDDTSGNFNDVGKSAGMWAAIFSKGLDIALDVGKKVVDIGKGAVEYNAQMESYSKTIEAFFKTSGQTAEEAAKNTAELIKNQKELSVQTGIGSDKLIDANKMLVAAGINGEKSQKAISALAKAVVATGGGNEELSRMASNLQQIQSVGKASSADMKQFSMAGIDVYGLMADSTGKTVDQLKEMDITFEMIVDALDNATIEGGKFFEASQVGASTLQGQMNLLESSVKEGLGTAFEPINEALREKLIPAAVDFVENIDWDAVGEAVGTIANGLANTLDTIVELKNWYDSVFGPPAQETIDAFTQTNEDLKQSFYETGGAVQVVDEDMANALESIKGHGNHMVMEFDGMQQGVTQSVQEMAGEIKNGLIDMGWEMMQQGETDARKFGQGIANGSIAPKTETQALVDDILKEVDIRSEAERYGEDFVSGYANGMHRNNGLISNAAATLANTIKQWLHFSKPDVGPLRSYESWMPDFVQGLADTMKASEWRLADASASLSRSITNNAITNNISMSVYGASGQDPNQLADLVMVRIQEATNRRNTVWA